MKFEREIDLVREYDPQRKADIWKICHCLNHVVDWKLILIMEIDSKIESERKI